jgi:hypothetical protein
MFKTCYNIQLHLEHLWCTAVTHLTGLVHCLIAVYHVGGHHLIHGRADSVYVTVFKKILNKMVRYKNKW